MDFDNQQHKTSTDLSLIQPVEQTAVKNFMANVFAYMFMALGISALFAYLFSTNSWPTCLISRQTSSHIPVGPNEHSLLHFQLLFCCGSSLLLIVRNLFSRIFLVSTKSGSQNGTVTGPPSVKYINVTKKFFAQGYKCFAAR